MNHMHTDLNHWANFTFYITIQEAHLSLQKAFWPQFSVSLNSLQSGDETSKLDKLNTASPYRGGLIYICTYVGVVCVLLRLKGFDSSRMGSRRHCLEAWEDVLFTYVRFIPLDVWVGSVRAAVVTVAYWHLCFVLRTYMHMYIRMFEGNSCRRYSRLEICLVWD